MSFFDDLIAATTLSEARAVVIGYAQAANLAVTSWIAGDVGQQIVEVCTQIAYAAERSRVRLTRGFASLDTSFDPGDVDPFDPTNAALAPGPGFLSNLGENVHGTERTEETFASGFVTFVNAGPSARTFKPYALTFTWTLNSPPTPRPTYRNSADATIYTNPDGSVTVGAGVTITFPVVAEERGTGSNTPASSLTLTTTLLGCSATNGSAVLAVDREAADTYKLKCRQASARLSFAAPADAIAYLSTKNLDGTPLLNATGNPVNINRVSVTNDSDTGIVNAYYAAPSGPAEDEDVEAANDNIELNAYAVTDCATFIGVKGTAAPISVVGSAKIDAGPGVTILAVRTAIAGLGSVVGAFPTAAKSIPVGGMNQDSAGAGTIYTADLRTIAAGAFPGLYDVRVTTPAGPETAIAAGGVVTFVSAITDWSITIT